MILIHHPNGRRALFLPVKRTDSHAFILENPEESPRTSWRCTCSKKSHTCKLRGARGRWTRDGKRLFIYTPVQFIVLDEHDREMVRAFPLCFSFRDDGVLFQGRDGYVYFFDWWTGLMHQPQRSGAAVLMQIRATRTLEPAPVVDFSQLECKILSGHKVSLMVRFAEKGVFAGHQLDDSTAFGFRFHKEMMHVAAWKVRCHQGDLQLMSKPCSATPPSFEIRSIRIFEVSNKFVVVFMGTISPVFFAAIIDARYCPPFVSITSGSGDEGEALRGVEPDVSLMFWEQQQ